MDHQPVQEAVSYRGLFTAGWFGVREKHCSRLKIYDRLRASEQADGNKRWRIPKLFLVVAIAKICRLLLAINVSWIIGFTTRVS